MWRVALLMIVIACNPANDHKCEDCYCGRCYHYHCDEISCKLKVVNGAGVPMNKLEKAACTIKCLRRRR